MMTLLKRQNYRDEKHFRDCQRKERCYKGMA